MFKKLLIAAVAVGAFAVNAPVALADHPPVAADCTFNGVTQATATGQDTWQAVVEGYVVGQPGEAVSIRCEIRVGTSVRGSTSTATGTSVAAVAEPVTYVRTLTETPQLCAVWTVGGHSGESCGATTTTQIPPQPVLDALEDVFDLLTEVEITYIDPLLCPRLAALNGTYGPITIKPGTGGTGGDIYINGELFWDCPGYEPEV